MTREEKAYRMIRGLDAIRTASSNPRLQYKVMRELLHRLAGMVEVLDLSQLRAVNRFYDDLVRLARSIR
jgi:hypothetical protein